MALRRRLWDTRLPRSVRPVPGCGSSSTGSRSATSPPRSNGRRSACSPRRAIRRRRRAPVDGSPISTTPRCRGCGRPTKRSRPRATSSTSRTSCCSWRASLSSATTSPAPSESSTAISWSTNTRTSTRCSRPCSTSGSATAATSASWATRPRPSTPSPEPRRATCASSPASTRTPPPSAWCATTGRRPRCSSSPMRCSARRRAAVMPACRRSGRRVLRCACCSTPTTSPRPPASPSRSKAFSPKGFRHVRSRCSTASTRSPNRSSRRCPKPASTIWCAGESVSSAARRCARPYSCCAVRPGPTTARPRWVPWCATSSPAPAGHPNAPPAVRCSTGGSRWRRSRPSPTTWWRRNPRRACPTSCVNSNAAWLSSTRRRSRASPSPRCTPRRGWSGTPSCSPAAPTGSCRSRTPKAPRRSRKSAG